MLKHFCQAHPEIRVKCVLADALDGTGKFLKKAANLFGGVQVISPLRSTQNLRFRGKKYSLEQYFARYPGVAQTIRIRGGRRSPSPWAVRVCRCVPMDKSAL